MRPAGTLICTVGTSLYFPNLASLGPGDPDPVRRALAEAYAARDAEATAAGLAALSPSDRLCGAEINSLTSLFACGYAVAKANLVFCHSATRDGRDIGRVLACYYRAAGHPVAEAIEIADLQDEDPERFRTRGLRQLTKTVCKIVRDYGADTTAINATGGYKAQIAVAVLMGQALAVPVYYKHERFDTIIPFPPLPVALDFDAWMRLSGLLGVLERSAVVSADILHDASDDADLVESLIERVPVDGREFVELSPTGQIFHETFRMRFDARRSQVLPPAVPPSAKQPVRWEASGHMRSHPEVERFLEAVTADVPAVRRCATFWFNPDCPDENRFRLGSKGIEGIYSNGTFTAKFRVETSAETDGQQAAVVAALNEWLQNWC